VTVPPLDVFLSACGSDEPLRLGVGPRDELEVDQKVIRSPFVVIGRSPETDLVLDHWQVSKRHAYLQLVDGKYLCVDMGSRTGTHGGDPSVRSGWIERGRTISIGPYTVRPEWPAPARPVANNRPKVTWELPAKALGQSLWRMDRPIALIGRSPACKIRISQEDVSKFHCSLVNTPVGLWVVDLLGQGGTTVNDQTVRYARLEDGDELRVGRHTLRPRYDASLPALVDPQSRAPLSVFPPSANMPWRNAESGQDVAFVEPPADGSVSALVYQFGQIQQQMFDQFHQTMMMMFEGFAAMHREQAASLRSEFDEVRKLSGEIESLREQTAKIARSTRIVPPTTAITAPEPPRPTYEPVAAPKRTIPAGDGGAEGDIHAQLCNKLAAIETERQNRWQKILGMMSANRS
jgi:pSer/pThr/pTyr-binding forkhead associated (FHA) protein